MSEPREVIQTGHETPAELLELYEVLEWNKAVEAQEEGDE